ncbi:MAG: hypothetical protein ACRDPC_03815 [Solirubrobacteraceae bacterium]
MALVVLVAIVLAGIAVAGGDNQTTTNPAPRDGVEAPTETTPSPDDPGSLPPEFVRCMADQGFEVDSPDDIHAAPPQVLQTCFATLHQGGATP